MKKIIVVFGFLLLSTSSSHSTVIVEDESADCKYTANGSIETLATGDLRVSAWLMTVGTRCSSFLPEFNYFRKGSANYKMVVKTIGLPEVGKLKKLVGKPAKLLNNIKINPCEFQNFTCEKDMTVNDLSW